MDICVCKAEGKEKVKQSCLLRRIITRIGKPAVCEQKTLALTAASVFE